MTTPSCMNCIRLGDCTLVDDGKLINGYYCGDWREANPVQVIARQQILQKFGTAGSSVLLNKPEAPKEGE